MRLVRSNIWLVILCLFTSCAGISINTTGANPPSGTISIKNFYNDSPGGPSDLSQRFTEDLREYFLQNAKKLEFVQSNADYKMEGSIAGYDISYIAPTNDGNTESSGMSRLTIKVNVDYTDTKDEKNSFKRVFSFYSDFGSDEALSDVEEEKVDEIIDQLIIDIFTASFDNW